MKKTKQTQPKKQENNITLSPWYPQKMTKKATLHIEIMKIYDPSHEDKQRMILHFQDWTG